MSSFWELSKCLLQIHEWAGSWKLILIYFTFWCGLFNLQQKLKAGFPLRSFFRETLAKGQRVLNWCQVEVAFAFFKVIEALLCMSLFPIKRNISLISLFESFLASGNRSIINSTRDRATLNYLVSSKEKTYPVKKMLTNQAFHFQKLPLLFFLLLLIK